MTRFIGAGTVPAGDVSGGSMSAVTVEVHTAPPHSRHVDGAGGGARLAEAEAVVVAVAVHAVWHEVGHPPTGGQHWPFPPVAMPDVMAAASTLKAAPLQRGKRRCHKVQAIDTHAVRENTPFQRR